MTEFGPIYGVELYDGIVLDGGMLQAMPGRKELDLVREKVGDRTVAAFEILTERFRRHVLKIKALEKSCEVLRARKIKEIKNAKSFSQDVADATEVLKT